MTTFSQRIAVLGLGRLGACLARALANVGFSPIVLSSRQRDTAERLRASLPATAQVEVVDVCDITRAADLICVAVPDAQVGTVCGEMSLSAAHAVVHLSGVLGLDALASASARGARTGALHPLQAFPHGAGPERFQGIYAGIEASDATLTRELEQLAQRLGAKPFSLQGVDRAGYHAAAVFASNYVVALHAAAAAVWRQAGLAPETARSALAPLTLGAAQAICERELPQALTGPVARGDASSVASHLRALSDDPARADLYRGLARELLGLPLSLDASARDALLKLLAGSS